MPSEARAGQNLMESKSRSLFLREALIGRPFFFILFSTFMCIYIYNYILYIHNMYIYIYISYIRLKAGFGHPHDRVCQPP